MSIATLILAAISNTLRTIGADHFKRPAGSYIPRLIPHLREAGADEGAVTVGLLSKLASDESFQEVTAEAVASGASFGACRYFRVRTQDTEEDVNGLEAIALLSELTADQLTSVRVQVGHHGRLELVSESIPLLDTAELHLVIGNPDDPTVAPDGATAVVYTWYPGRLTAEVPLASATVKLG